MVMYTYTIQYLFEFQPLWALIPILYIYNPVTQTNFSSHKYVATFVTINALPIVYRATFIDKQIFVLTVCSYLSRVWLNYL